ncbi:MAG: hypothetical protein JOZ81_25300 [Chloroflexi bacterium]|nr:hypothetical protein [Chloroflexota bacterium]
MHEAADLLEFVGWIDMVELEHNRIGDSAIDAALISEIRPNPGLKLSRERPGPLSIATDVRLLVSRVMVAPIRRDAGLTPAMLMSRLLVSKAEFG